MPHLPRYSERELAMLDQKSENLTIEGLGLLDVAEMSRAVDQSEASPGNPPRHFARHLRRCKAVLVTNDDMGRHADLLQVRVSIVVDASSDSLQIRVLVQDGHAGDQALERSGSSRSPDERARDTSVQYP